MTVREQIEAREAATLSPRATLSQNSQGRVRPEEPSTLRPVFQRDRDRIIHCKAFRRLKHKTQMVLSPDGDHYRTRLTHTLEVAQVARTLARSLFLNEDLAEAIALGHDLGHTPFGHMGERTLAGRLPGGFSHNQQSLRVVDVLEGDGGLNLTFEVRDGILHHSGAEQPVTPEGRCVHLADRIAYINHDIDDAIRAGALAQSDLPARSLAVLGNSHGQRINTMICDIVQHSADSDQIRMSPEIGEATDLLREFLFERVYYSDWKHAEEEKAGKLIEMLIEYCLEHPTQMPLEYVEISYRDGIERAVCDFVACMTDRYAMQCYQAWILPEAFMHP